MNNYETQISKEQYEVSTRKIKALAYAPDNEHTQKLAICGALALYLDFINLFIMLLRIFGQRK